MYINYVNVTEIVSRMSNLNAHEWDVTLYTPDHFPAKSLEESYRKHKNNLLEKHSYNLFMSYTSVSTQRVRIKTNL